MIQQLAAKGLCPATGGNFSIRSGPSELLISRSGVDKNRLTEEDFLRCDLSGKPLDSSKEPSAETALHGAVYQREPEAASILHTHSVPATILSRLEKGKGAIEFYGYEMQKSIRGMRSHEETLELPIVENSQDIAALQNRLLTRWEELGPRFGFLLSGHGLYAWGASSNEALRHIEGYEFLLDAEFHRRLLERAA